MTDDLIEAVALAIDEYVGDISTCAYWARAAIRAAAPLILDMAADECEWPKDAAVENEHARGMMAACVLNQQALRQLKERFQ